MNAIDSKKKENIPNDEFPNYPAFIRGLILYSIYILITFVLVGSIGLYICKVAQSNVLPDNLNYLPFGNKYKESNEIPVDINIIKIYGLMGLGLFLGETPIVNESTKIIFNEKEIADSYKSGIIGFLNSLKSNPEKASFFGLYINDVIEPIIANNNWLINNFFGNMCKYISESIIIILFPLIICFVIPLLFISNIILCFFYQIKNWSDFFMDKSIKNNTVTWNEPFTYFRPIRAFLLMLYCFFLFFPLVSCLPLFTTLYSIFAPLGLTANIYKTNKSLNFLSFMKDVIMYKSQLYLILFTIGLLSQSSTYLGTNGFIACVVGVLIVFFILHLYNPFIPKNNPNETPVIEQTKSKMKGGKKNKK